MLEDIFLLGVVVYLLRRCVKARFLFMGEIVHLKALTKQDSCAEACE